MQHFLQTVLSALVAPFLFIGGFFAPAPMPPQVIDQTRVEEAYRTIDDMQRRVALLEHEQAVQAAKLGATNAIPTTVALYEDSLAAKITSTQTTMTLVRGTDKTGTALASSTYAFIIDEGLSTEEMVLADCTGTTCTNLTRGISILTGTTTVSALRKEHRRGASVKITDGPQLIILSRIINGQGTVPNLLSYTSGTACSVGSANTVICDKAYIDGVAVAGASNANDTTKGIVEMATGAEAAAGTSLGGTGARLALGSNIATSTCQVSTANSVVITQSSNGKINSTCLDMAGNFAFTGNNTHSGTETFSGTVALATTTQFGTNGGLMPVGSMTAYASTTPPTGWLKADGTAVSRTAYSALFAVIGTTYGVGDGSTTFNLPNLKGRNVIGIGSATTTIDTLGETGGEDTHLLTTNEMPSHDHFMDSGASGGGGAGTLLQYGTGGGGTRTSGATGGGAVHNVLDPYIVLQYIIKY